MILTKALPDTLKHASTQSREINFHFPLKISEMKEMSISLSSSFIKYVNYYTRINGHTKVIFLLFITVQMLLQLTRALNMLK